MPNQELLELKDRYENGDESAIKEIVKLLAEDGQLLSQAGFYEMLRNAITQGAYSIYDEEKTRRLTVDLSDFEVELSNELDGGGYRKYRIIKKREQ